MEAVNIGNVFHTMELENGIQTNNAKNYSNQMQGHVNKLPDFPFAWYGLESHHSCIYVSIQLKKKPKDEEI